MPVSYCKSGLTNKCRLLRGCVDAAWRKAPVISIFGVTKIGKYPPMWILMSILLACSLACFAGLLRGLDKLLSVMICLHVSEVLSIMLIAIPSNLWFMCLEKWKHQSVYAVQFYILMWHRSSLKLSQLSCSHPAVWSQHVVSTCLGFWLQIAMVVIAALHIVTLLCVLKYAYVQHFGVFIVVPSTYISRVMLVTQKALCQATHTIYSRSCLW